MFEANSNYSRNSSIIMYFIIVIYTTAALTVFEKRAMRTDCKIRVSRVAYNTILYFTPRSNGSRCSIASLLLHQSTTLACKSHDTWSIYKNRYRYSCLCVALVLLVKVCTKRHKGVNSTTALSMSDMM